MTTDYRTRRSPIPFGPRPPTEALRTESECHPALLLDEQKPWWQSRTFWGLAVSAAAQIAGRFGYELDANLATEIALDLASLAGLAFAWLGRVRATRLISRTRVAPGIDLEQAQ